MTFVDDDPRSPRPWRPPAERSRIPHSYASLCDRPAVFEFNRDKLWDAQILVVVDQDKGSETSFSYGELQRRLQVEGFLESNWDAFAEVKTKLHTYGRSLSARDENDELWRVFCLECHLLGSRSLSLDRSMWFRYEQSHVVDDPYHEADCFFVVVNGEIVETRFLLGAHHRSEAKRFEEQGLWSQVRPEAETPHWSNDGALRIGFLRSYYQRFYEETAIGRACCLAPGSKRLDSEELWFYSGGAESDSGHQPLEQVRRHVSAVAREVASLKQLVLLLIAAVVLDVMIRWIGHG